uniref:GDP-D-glucose phosphorylase 1 n=1 Tax=Phallusia mammillata TaxID=59560 RepID=A0A6F9DE63_9ASCI|nr:GDP-D-glucose phosphorylase 1 [Phallusia mammillata]
MLTRPAKYVLCTVIMNGLQSDCETIVGFCYSGDDLIDTPNDWNGQNASCSNFDKILHEKWKKAEDSGILKYTLSDCEYKVLSGDISDESASYVAQLNPQRGFNRRKREAFDSMNQKFSPNQFNFTKIKNNEILFNLKPGDDTAVGIYKKNNHIDATDHSNDNLVAVNISPIDNCHVLVIPSCSTCQPQRLTTISLLMAMDVVQLSSRPDFRVGFNSLYAWASVNHLHYHAMLFNFKLFIDDLDSSTLLQDHCFIIEKSYMNLGFLFHVPMDALKRIEVAKQVVSITEMFHKREVPYNIEITRSTKSNIDTRIFLWPRKSMKDLTPSPCFDVACVDLGGQIKIKKKTEFTSLTFAKAKKVLMEAGLDRTDFMQLIDEIKNM